MEQFKKDIYKMSDNRVAVVILLVCAVLMLGLGVLVNVPNYSQFDGFSGGDAKMEALLCDGPIAEIESDGTLFYMVYENTETVPHVVAAKSDFIVPVYGVDIQADTDLNSLKTQTVKGSSTRIPAELQSIVEEYMEGDSRLSEVGTYYLDTTTSPVGDAFIFYVLAVILAVIAVVCIISHKKVKNKIDLCLEQMEQSGILQVVADDFVQSNAQFDKKLSLAVSNAYVINAADPKVGIQVFSLQGVTNAYKCRMVDGEPSTVMSLALENENGRQLVGKAANKSQEKRLDAIVARVKAQIGGGM